MRMKLAIYFKKITFRDSTQSYWRPDGIQDIFKWKFQLRGGKKSRSAVLENNPWVFQGSVAYEVRTCNLGSFLSLSTYCIILDSIAHRASGRVLAWELILALSLSKLCNLQKLKLHFSCMKYMKHSITSAIRPLWRLKEIMQVICSPERVVQSRLGVSKVTFLSVFFGKTLSLSPTTLKCERRWIRTTLNNYYENEKRWMWKRLENCNFFVWVLAFMVIAFP